MNGFMDIGDVSEYLGWEEATVTNLVTAKELTGVKMKDKKGKDNWLFSKSLIDKWIEDFVKKFEGETLEEKTLIKKIEEKRHLGIISKKARDVVYTD